MSRLSAAWRALQREQRLAATAALGLFASMFLPWYSKTDTLVVRSAVKATETSLTAFQAFSFVEAAVLLVSAAVLTMLFARAERRAFSLPGGDGLMTMVAGGWTALLIFYRLLDKPGLQAGERVTAAVGVEWGIFVALLLALGLAYAGARMRALEAPEPPLRRARGARPRGQADTLAPAGSRKTAASQLDDERPLADAETAVIARRRRPPADVAPVRTHEPDKRARRPRYPPAPHASSSKGEQLSFEDPPTWSER